MAKGKGGRGVSGLLLVGTMLVYLPFWCGKGKTSLRRIYICCHDFSFYSLYILLLIFFVSVLISIFFKRLSGPLYPILVC